MSLTDHFSIVGDTVAPQPWMQLRQVATASQASVAKSYDVTGASTKFDLIQVVQTDWRNNTPIPQWVYGMVTHGGGQVTLQCRSRAYLMVHHGVEISEDGLLITMIEASRFGVGADIGKGGVLATGTGFAIAELRQNSCTVPLMPGQPGWFLVQPGDKFNARVEVRFVSDFWENSVIDGGDAGSESRFISGDVRLDLFAVPMIDPLLPNATPSIRDNGGSPVVHDCGLGPILSVIPPETLAIGDSLIAVVTNVLGGIGQVVPVDTPDLWQIAHQRVDHETVLTVWTRFVDDLESLPETLDFENASGGESIVAMFAVAGALPFFTNPGPEGWGIASVLTQANFLSEHFAPSQNRGGAGQLLAVIDFLEIGESWPLEFVHELIGLFSEVVNITCTSSSILLGFLFDPHIPTPEDVFKYTNPPGSLGTLFGTSILIPGLDIIEAIGG